MAAGVGDGELKIGVDLFGCRDAYRDWLSFVGIDTARIGIEDKLGVDERAMIFQQPVDTVGGTAFLIRGEGEDQVAVRLVVFLLETDEEWRPAGRLRISISWVPRP